MFKILRLCYTSKWNCAEGKQASVFVSVFANTSTLSPIRSEKVAYSVPCLSKPGMYLNIRFSCIIIYGKFPSSIHMFFSYIVFLLIKAKLCYWRMPSVWCQVYLFFHVKIRSVLVITLEKPNLISNL